MVVQEVPLENVVALNGGTERRHGVTSGNTNGAITESGYYYDDGVVNDLDVDLGDEEEEEEDDDDDDNGGELGVTGRTALNRRESRLSRRRRGIQRTKYVTFILGRRYDPELDHAARRAEESSLLWFTYRMGFPEMSPYGICTDAGWGCMLRSAQMLMAQAWRVHGASRDGRPALLLQWFADFPSQSQHWYSLHNMVAAGMSRYQMLPGEWYGPGTACHVLRDLCEIHRRASAASLDPKENKRSIFRVHVAQEGAIYKETIHNLMTPHGCNTKKESAEEPLPSPPPPPPPQQPAPEDVPSMMDPLLHPPPPPVPTESEVKPTESSENLEWDTALLLLIPLRLGLKTFNAPSYGMQLAHTMKFRQSVGFVGGSPRHALWFYGATSDGLQVHGLDPHTVQPAPKRRGGEIVLSPEHLQSVHCPDPSTIDMARIDPSLALGFYCRDRDDFEDWLISVAAMRENCSGLQLPELFSVAETSPEYYLDTSVGDVAGATTTTTLDLCDDLDVEAEEGGGGNGGGSARHYAVGGIDNDDDDDEYVML